MYECSSLGQSFLFGVYSFGKAVYNENVKLN